MRYSVSLFIFLSLFGILHAQIINVSTDSLLHQISSLQSANDDFYRDGLFPTQRFKGHNRHVKEDNTIFYSALVAYTLKSLHKYCSFSDKVLIDSLVASVEPNYPFYKNRRGGNTYNYWQTKPDLAMPNSRLFENSNKALLPDDFDCSSIIYLAKEKDVQSDNVYRQVMLDYTNSNKKTITSTLTEFRDFKAYPTWFSDKMKQDMDICVISNVLLFVTNRGFENESADSSSILFIREAVLSGVYLKHPYILSSYYKNKAIILYHLTRLISSTDEKELLDLKPNLIEDIYALRHKAKSKMEQVLLAISLLRLGEFVDVDFDLEYDDLLSFSYFTVTPFFGSSVFLKRLVGKSYFLQRKTRSEAYYLCLILELELLLKNQNQNLGN